MLTYDIFFNILKILKDYFKLSSSKNNYFKILELHLKWYLSYPNLYLRRVVVVYQKAYLWTEMLTMFVMHHCPSKYDSKVHNCQIFVDTSKEMTRYPI